MVMSAGGVIGVTVLIRTATSNASFWSVQRIGVVRQGRSFQLTSEVVVHRDRIAERDVDVATRVPGPLRRRVADEPPERLGALAAPVAERACSSTSSSSS